jgi:alpha-galactosidase
MPKVTILGAGSGFTQPLCKDIMLIDGLDSGEFALVDIDRDRLELAHKLVEKAIEQVGKKFTVISSVDRKEVIEGSDYLINTIEVSGLETVRHDNDIPLKYGVSQCIGDTIGPGGLFKALRTVPAWVDILRDAEKLCPNAMVMNYTNPMSMMTLAGLRSTSLPLVGLCHSVQGTSRQLAKWCGVPYEELEWDCAGINHMAWFTKLRHNGKDLYPVLKEKVRQDSELYEKSPVRFEMMLEMGYFVSESSGHFSEYVPYFRKREDLIEKYCREGYQGQTSFYADEWPKWRAEADEWKKKQLSGEEELDIKRSYEYGSVIIEGMEFDRPQVIYGSVLNQGLIENLPQDGVVEVACLVDKKGVRPTRFGRLPSQVAALCRANMSMFELGVDAALTRSREKAVHALMLDPLTAAVCSLAEIRSMVYELFEAEKAYLPDFE